jgi:hypothetical protein
MEPIRIEFTLTSTDFAAALIAHYRNRRAVFVGLTALGLAFVYGLYLAFTQSAAQPRNPTVVGALIILPVVVAVALVVYVPWSAARRARRNRRLTARTTWEISGDQIHTRTPYGEGMLTASTFQRITETPQYYLLHFRAQPRLYQIVPKRAFDSVAHETAFRKWLKQFVVEQM